MNGFMGDSSWMKYQSTANTSTKRMASGLDCQSTTTISAPARPAIASASPSPGQRLVVQ
jgi:hypothetical protein